MPRPPLGFTALRFNPTYTAPLGAHNVGWVEQSEAQQAVSTLSPSPRRTQPLSFAALRLNPTYPLLCFLRQAAGAMPNWLVNQRVKELGTE